MAIYPDSDSDKLALAFHSGATWMSQDFLLLYSYIVKVFNRCFCQKWLIKTIEKIQNIG